MTDFAVPAEAPGHCPKCQGTGEYRWGGTTNGRPNHVGRCFSCRGSGWQTRADINRNWAYNRFRISNLEG